MKSTRALLIAAGFSGALLSGGVLIADREGRVLGTYVDPAGILTACYGHTGAELRHGQRFTEDQCLHMLATDLHVFNRQLLRLTAPVSLTEGEHAAYLSFTYNAGAENFRRSTLRQKLLAGDRVGACHELTRWVYARGVKFAGLIKRREAERDLCLRDL